MLESRVWGVSLSEELQDRAPKLRKELLNEFFKGKQKPKNIKRLENITQKDSETQHDGRYKIMVRGEIIFKAFGDHGSDVNALSTKMLNQITEKNNSVRV